MDRLLPPTAGQMSVCLGLQVHLVTTTFGYYYTLKLCCQQIPNFSRAWRSVVLSPFLTGRVVTVTAIVLLQQLGYIFTLPCFLFP